MRVLHAFRVMPSVVHKIEIWPPANKHTYVKKTPECAKKRQFYLRYNLQRQIYCQNEL